MVSYTYWSTLASFSPFQHTGQTSASVPWHQLLLLPEVFFLQISACSISVLPRVFSQMPASYWSDDHSNIPQLFYLLHFSIALIPFNPWFSLLIYCLLSSLSNRMQALWEQAFLFNLDFWIFMNKFKNIVSFIYFYYHLHGVLRRQRDEHLSQIL